MKPHGSIEAMPWACVRPPDCRMESLQRLVARRTLAKCRRHTHSFYLASARNQGEVGGDAVEARGEAASPW
jgi:hypothetical protein